MTKLQAVGIDVKDVWSEKGEGITRYKLVSAGDVNQSTGSIVSNVVITMYGGGWGITL